jgi:hypothetical protein
MRPHDPDPAGRAECTPVFFCASRVPVRLLRCSGRHKAARAFQPYFVVDESDKCRLEYGQINLF